VNITTSAQNFETSVALDTFVRSRISNALAPFVADVIAIDVFMKDVNGPKGGVDKQALIRVQLRNRQVITIESEHENLYAAVRTGVKRLRRAVRRQLGKSRQIDKRQMNGQVAHAAMPRVP
jgi:ribosome-associated translation inhibitor RaiA